MEITIRRATPDDAEAFVALFSGPRAIWGTLQIPYTSAEQRRRRLAELGDGSYPLVAVVDGEVVGQLTLHTSPNSPRRRHAGSLGMAVRDEWQGKGVGTRLMDEAIALADRWLNLTRLELSVFVDNDTAIRLYERFGFEIEGRLRQYALRDGAFIDVYMMGRLRPPR